MELNGFDNIASRRTIEKLGAVPIAKANVFENKILKNLEVRK